jgi:predicted nucleic acid-binding protein
MIYVDTSCFLKLFRPEILSEAVWRAVEREAAVIVSVLTELETHVQLKAAWKGGRLSQNQFRQAEARLGLMRNQSPFDFRTLGGAVFQTALRQHRNSREHHCRSLDRLHLAAMEELKLSRLMTHDEAQAGAALEAGFEVVRPGRD